MNRADYLAGLAKRVLTLGDDVGLDNQRSQLRSKALLAVLSPAAIPGIGYRYDTDRLVRNGTFIFQSVVRLVAEGFDRTQFLHPMTAAAEIFEYLSNLDEGTPPHVASILAAGLYQLAGFQANALCLARSIPLPELRDDEFAKPSPLLARWMNLSFRRRFVALQSETARVGSMVDRVNVGIVDLPHDPEAHVDEALTLYQASLIVRVFRDFLRFVLRGEDSQGSLRTALAALLTTFQQTGQANDFLLGKLFEALFSTLESSSTWTTLRDRISGDEIWRKYAALLARGFANNMLEARGSVELWSSQQIAIASGFLSSASSFVIRMPTSAGKTRIAELAILNALTHAEHRRAVYIAPYLALVAELESNLQDVFGGLGFQVSTLIGSFELDDVDDYLVQITDVLVATPEKLVALVRRSPQYFKSVGTIVVDEGHVLDDPERGPRCELLLTALRDLTPEDCQTVFISAVVPLDNAAQLAEWLCDRREALVTTDWRPTRQRLGLMTWERTTGRVEFPSEAPVTGRQAPFVPRVISQRPYRDFTTKLRKEKTTEFPNPANKSEIAAELALAYSQLGPVLIFTTNPVWAESCGKAVANALRLRGQTDGAQTPPAFLRAVDRAAASASVEASDAWLGAESLISRLLRVGVGVHHGGLPEAVRRAIERDFRDGVLPLMVATNTLAQGVNLPIKTVVVHAAIRYRKGETPNDAGESEAITQREFWNICGRAGRAGAETEGQILFVALNDRDRRVFAEFAQQDYEPVTGRLFEILVDLSEQRLSQDSFTSQLDSEIIAMMVEEAPDIEEVTRRLQRSFVSVQSRDRSIPMEPLLLAARATATQTLRLVPDLAHREVFARTGLSVASCLQIWSAITDESAVLRPLLESPTAGIDETLSALYEIVGPIAEMQPRYVIEADQRQLLLDWVHQTSIPDLKAEHCQTEAEEQRLTRFIEDYHGYRLPWGIAGALQLSRLVMSDIELSDQARWLPSMVKFGVSSPIACWAMSLGAPTRPLASAISAGFLQDIGAWAFPEFVRWFSALTEEDFAFRFGASEHQAFALNRKARTLTRAAREQVRDAGVEGRLSATVRGIQYEGREAFAQQLTHGEEVSLKREYENQYDPNAVIVVARGNMIGYVERPIASEVAPLMDSGIELHAAITEVSRSPQLALRVEIWPQ